jgi:hypothetical protein
MMVHSRKKKPNYFLKGILILLGLGFILAAAGIVTILAFPGAAAQGSDLLRAVIGDQAVAQLETTVYQAQDAYLRWKYNHNQGQVQAPWQEPTQPIQGEQPQATIQVGIPISAQATPTVEAKTRNVPPAQGIIAEAQTAQPSATPQPPKEWTLAPISTLGGSEGEGVWAPYLFDPAGKTVALRTFVRPDPDRPYALVAIIAFDLQATRLHFVLGRDEPYSTVAIQRDGLIPEQDRLPGRLLATFNGGFKGRHGNFGVMVNGTQVIPPKDGLGTVAFYQDGAIKIGAWGTEITPAANLETWRQNGPLVVHDRQINPHVSDDNPQVWGYTIKEMAPIWRSGIGISPDGNVLYYFAGPSLTLPTLARAIQASGAANAIQLDINNYWVHFDAIQVENGQLTPQTLFPEWQNEMANRYLLPYTRDYFYVTTAP